MDPTQRFTKRVQDYVRYRPDYPPALLDFLRQAVGLAPDWRVADMGSGTGLLSRLFLEFGNSVVGIEPNEAMRRAGESELRDYPRFDSLAGRAESCSLADGCVDLVVAGQAFHWFQPEASRAEFGRISRPPHRVALIWNDRNDSTPFVRGYNQLMEEFAGDTQALRMDPSSDAAIEQFFGAGNLGREQFAHQQRLDYVALVGRAVSSSCAPLAGEPRYEAMVKELAALFRAQQRDGQVTLTYTTRLFWGNLLC